VPHTSTAAAKKSPRQAGEPREWEERVELAALCLLGTNTYNNSNNCKSQLQASGRRVGSFNNKNCNQSERPGRKIPCASLGRHSIFLPIILSFEFLIVLNFSIAFDNRRQRRFGYMSHTSSYYIDKTFRSNFYTLAKGISYNVTHWRKLVLL